MYKRQGHYHELTGDRKGEWACDLDQPYRLIFEPHEKPIPVSYTHLQHNVILPCLLKIVAIFFSSSLSLKLIV